LCLEDSEQDYRLIKATLAANGIHCELTNVRSEQDFRAALMETGCDLILSDFTLPGYDGMSALAFAQIVRPATPFIFISGTIGPERAAKGLKAGAKDFLSKDQWHLLAATVRRSLHQAQDASQILRVLLPAEQAHPHSECQAEPLSTDIGDRIHLEERLRRDAKMEAVGQLAAGVAQAFKTLLTTLRCNSELMLINRQSLTPAESASLLRPILAASDRAAGLTRQLSALGRQQIIQHQCLNLNVIVQNLAQVLPRTASDRVRWRFTFDPDLPLIGGDSGMLKQMVINLVNNALDAMPKGGWLVISTSRVKVDVTKVTCRQEARSGEYVCLNIRDNGCGILPENLPRIFEPFFTTKEIGSGTGLGLAFVYGAVNQHQGWIDVTSKVNHGTTCKVFLPAATRPPASLPVH